MIDSVLVIRLQTEINSNRMKANYIRKKIIRIKEMSDAKISEGDSLSTSSSHVNNDPKV